MNDFNYSAAQSALVTAQVNADKDSKFKVSHFLPFPMIFYGEVEDLEADVARTILESLDHLPQKLKTVLVPFHDKFIGTYYWKSCAFFYR